jgi:hypothetical protein
MLGNVFDQFSFVHKKPLGIRPFITVVKQMPASTRRVPWRETSTIGGQQEEIITLWVRLKTFCSRGE